MKRFVALSLICVVLSTNAAAQFTGSRLAGKASSVEQARNARVDTYVTVAGNIIAHLREDYYTFRDTTGDIRVEIEGRVWRNREVGPDTAVRLLAEVDRNAAGTVYLWVKSLEIVE